MKENTRSIISSICTFTKAYNKEVITNALSELKLSDMNRIYVFSCLLLLQAFLVESQDYWSTLTMQEKETNVLGSFSHNDSLFILATQSVTDSILKENTIVLSIHEDGSTTLRKSLGGFKTNKSSFLTLGDSLVLATESDTQVCLRFFDSAFDSLNLYKYQLPGIDGYFVIRKLLALRDHFIVIGDEQLFQENENGFILAIDRHDPSSFVFEITDQVFLREELYDAQNLGDSTFLIMRRYPYNELNGILQFQAYTVGLVQTSNIATEIEASSSFSGKFKLLNNMIVINEIATKRISTVDLTGNLQWQLDFNSLFEGQDYNYINMADELICVNGDIITCGWGEWTGHFEEYSDGLVASFSGEGEVKWKRAFREGINGEFVKGVLTDVLQNTDGYLFSGHTSNYPVVNIKNHVWTLSLDTLGCIDSSSCDEFQLVGVKEAESQSHQLFKVNGNPISENLVLTSIHPEKISVSVINASGAVLFQTEILNGAKKTLALTDLPPGIYYVNGNCGELSQVAPIVKQ